MKCCGGYPYCLCPPTAERIEWLNQVIADLAAEEAERPGAEAPGHSPELPTDSLTGRKVDGL